MVTKRRMNCPVCRTKYQLNISGLLLKDRAGNMHKRLKYAKLDEKNAELTRLILNYLKMS